MQRFFEEKQHALLYANSRPQTATEVFEKIFAYLEQQREPPHELALDVGCGTGLSTCGLAGKFKRVIGIDVSDSMIAEAQTGLHPDNVSFQLGTAEALPADDGSVDLITSVSAAHWFDRDKFYVEAKRVLKPGGVVALSGVSFPTVSCPQQPESRITEEYDKTFAFFIDQPTWPKSATEALRRYTDYVLPFSEWTRDDAVFVDEEWTIERLVAFAGSVSAVRLYMRENPAEGDVLKQFEARLIAALSDPSDGAATPICVSWNPFILMGRKALI